MTISVEQVYREVTVAVNRAITATPFFDEALERCAAGGVCIKGVDLVIAIEHWVGAPQRSDEQLLQAMGIRVDEDLPLTTPAPEPQPAPSPAAPVQVRRGRRIATALRNLVKAFSASPEKS